MAPCDMLGVQQIIEAVTPHSPGWVFLALSFILIFIGSGRERLRINAERAADGPRWPVPIAVFEPAPDRGDSEADAKQQANCAQAYHAQRSSGECERCRQTLSGKSSLWR